MSGDNDDVLMDPKAKDFYENEKKKHNFFFIQPMETFDEPPKEYNKSDLYDQIFKQLKTFPHEIDGCFLQFIFKEKGKQAAYNRVKQLHDNKCFKPINLNSLNEQKRKRALK